MRTNLWIPIACLAIATGCAGQREFRGATAADAAACRNVARDVTKETWGKSFDDAYNDCMISRGFAPLD